MTDRTIQSGDEDPYRALDLPYPKVLDDLGDSVSRRNMRQIMLRVMTPAMGWTRYETCAIAAKAIIVSCHGTPPSLKPLKALHLTEAWRSKHPYNGLDRERAIRGMKRLIPKAA